MARPSSCALPSTPSRVLRPDLEFLRSGLQTQDLAREGIGYVRGPVAGDDDVIAERRLARRGDAALRLAGLEVEKLERRRRAAGDLNSGRGKVVRAHIERVRLVVGQHAEGRSQAVRARLDKLARLSFA